MNTDTDTDTDTDSDSDSKHCIVHAADTLHEQSGRARFPTVDAVRRQARVSMNDANTVMKQWRRTHLSGRQTEPAQIPSAVEATHAPYWRHCGWQETAGQSLGTMRAFWDADARKENSAATKWPKPLSPGTRTGSGPTGDSELARQAH